VVIESKPADFARDAREVFVCIKGEDVLVLKSLGPLAVSARNRLPGIVNAVTQEGPMFRIEIDCGFTLTALPTRQACEELALQEDDRVVAMVKETNVHLIPRSK
jgi:molybdate transport system ATP-binding protein